MSPILSTTIAALCMLPGLVGLLVPVIPGIPYMWVVALVYGFLTRFDRFTTTELGILAVVAVLSVLVDYLAGILGAKYGGASKKAVLFGFIGTIAGTILIPPFGGIAGLFAGIMVAEVAQYRDHAKALKAATGGVLGALAGMAVNLLLGITFFIAFILFALR